MESCCWFRWMICPGNLETTWISSGLWGKGSETVNRKSEKVEERCWCSSLAREGKLSARHIRLNRPSGWPVGVICVVSLISRILRICGLREQRKVLDLDIADGGIPRMATARCCCWCCSWIIIYFAKSTDFGDGNGRKYISNRRNWGSWL
jgi:hypothetical protein